MFAFRFWIILFVLTLGISDTAAAKIQFIHRTTVDNIYSNYTIISHPTADRYSEAILVIKRKMNLPRGYFQATPMLRFIEGHWQLFFHDGSPMPKNAQFLIAIQQVPNRTGFSLLMSTSDTWIENPLLNENPHAKFHYSIEERGNRNIGCQQIDIFYDQIKKRWKVRNPKAGNIIRINFLIEEVKLRQPRFIHLVI